MMNYTDGAARRQLPANDFEDEAEIQDLLDAGVLVTDERRRRPFYFDGRFLAARDLTNEQNYFLTRQADLGQAGGAGVIHGLMVSKESGSLIRIEAGSGVTSAGELVVLYDTIPRLDLSDIAETQRLNGAFGLSKIPNEAARTRSGIYILALRPVEFTANPIGSYPTSITGQRTVQDGDIVEASAVTLIPYPEGGTRNGTTMRRSRIARRIFLGGGEKGVTARVLPLAMIAIDRGVVQWVDPYMVRREVGAEHGDILGLGFAPRASREAHLLQYEYQLSEVLLERGARGPRFAASEYFFALPPAGHLPSGVVDGNDFTQLFFPPAAQVELTVVPEDEVAALLEESLLLPPIDLTLNDDEMASTSVMILIPVSRRDFRSLNSKLSSLRRDLKPAAPGMLAKRTPLEALRVLKPGLLAAVETMAKPGDDEWRRLLSGSRLLWYMRRRNLSYRVEATGNDVLAFDDESVWESQVDKLVKATGLQTAFSTIKKRASAQAVAAIYRYLSQPKFKNSKVLLSAVVNAFAKLRVRKITLESVRKVTGEFEFKEAGEGLRRLERSHPKLMASRQFVKAVTEAGLAQEVDRRAMKLSEDELHDFARELGAGHTTRRGGAAASAKKKTPATPAVAREEPEKSPEPTEVAAADQNESDEAAELKKESGAQAAAEKGGATKKRTARKSAKKSEKGER